MQSRGLNPGSPSLGPLSGRDPRGLCYMHEGGSRTGGFSPLPADLTLDLSARHLAGGERTSRQGQTHSPQGRLWCRKRRGQRSQFVWCGPAVWSGPLGGCGEPLTEVGKRGVGFKGGGPGSPPWDRNRPANAGDVGSIPGPGRPHRPQSSEAAGPQLLSLSVLQRLRATSTEPTHRSH